MHRMSYKLLIPSGLLAALFMMNPVARAVGLGPVEVDSSLNQPLRAEIPLLSVGGLEPGNIEVGLASPEDFSRVGIERPAVLERLTFTVERDGGQPVIRVTSERPVTEPFLSFLVRVSWPQGRLLREYTVLLDPPVMAPAAAPAPEQAPARTVDRGETAARPEADAGRPAAADETAARQPSDEAAPRGAGGGQYGPVASGETLWRIASRTRPDDSISVNQMMVALLRTNPDAFFRDNINALKRGAVLRVPERGEIQRLTVAEAVSAVQRQNQLWQDYRRNLAEEAPTVVAGGEPTERAQEQAPEGEDASRLELVPPREGETGAEAARAGQTGAEASRDELRQELSRSREELLARREQNDQLDGRVSELEAQVERLQRLLELKNQELAAMQSQAGDGEPSAPAGEESMAAEGGTPMDQPEVVAEEQAEATGSEAPVAEAETAAPAGGPAETASETAAQTEEPEEETAAAKTPPAPADRGWMDLLLSPVVLGIAGLVLIGIGVALFLHRRGSGYADPTLQRQTLGQRIASSEASTRESEAVEEEQEAEIAGEADLGPPEAGPADYDEAALRAALEENPSDTDTRLKLIRHYAATNQREAFIAQAETLYADLADPSAPEWMETRQLGEEIAPDHALFGGSAEDIRSTTTEEEADTRFQEEAPDEPESTQPAWGTEESTAPGQPGEDETRAREPESGSDLPDLDFEAPGGEEEAAPADQEATPEEGSPGEPDAPAETREYDLSDLEGGTEDTPGPGGKEEPSGPGADERPEEDFDFGGSVESRERDDQEPLEFDLSDFESGEETEEPPTGQADTDEQPGTPDAGMETPSDEAADTGGAGEAPSEDAAAGGGEAVDTKLELADAYLDMGDHDGAREMLQEVVSEGDEAQQKRAREMLDKL